MHFLYPSQNLWLNGTWTHTALHFSLKRNVYLNQINNQRESSALHRSAYKSCCLPSYAFPTGRHFGFLFCLLQQRQGGKCIPVLKSNKSSLLFRVLNQIKHPSFGLLPSPENEKVAEIPTTGISASSGNVIVISFACSH